MSMRQEGLGPVSSVTVSPEMTTLIGAGDVSALDLPREAALLVFAFGGVGTPATLRLVADAGHEELGDGVEGERSLSLLVSRPALLRLFGWAPQGPAEQRYHLTSGLRGIALALASCAMTEPSREAYRIGKSIELLCETLHLLVAGELVPVAGESLLSQSDSSRLVAARRIIDERWSEKLTLDGLARACGLNRAKLTRGFRELYECTVAEAIAERRLMEASRKLLTTDMPVSSIGYASGYLNNASFSRAFGRRFGISPSGFRLSGAA